MLYRKAGADLSDPSEVFVMPDVVKPFDVFNEVSFLSRHTALPPPPAMPTPNANPPLSP